MRPARLLLHALLCFALVANGVGAAMASVRGSCGHAGKAGADVSAMTHTSVIAHAPGMTHAAAPTQAKAEAHCAEMVAMAAADDADTVMHHDLPADDANDAGDTGNDECDDACSCACASHGFAVLMPPALSLPTGVRIADTRTRNTSHATPSLPHPIRPPIA
ncbi:CopL family metal-binding regulatory protein [Lysobacter hankyongensis]|uniref:CopL family metal-binding regulatory protein n=1 Tax=Lysobacter hankyongensis TaxID=1176535 RepID=A0ABP9AVB5_9GAMM